MNKFKIYVLRKSDIRSDKLQYYTPISVKVLKNYGYDLIGFSDDENVFLDNESYKNFMNLQSYLSAKGDNTVVLGVINNKPMKR